MPIFSLQEDPEPSSNCMNLKGSVVELHVPLDSSSEGASYDYFHHHVRHRRAFRSDPDRLHRHRVAPPLLGSTDTPAFARFTAARTEPNSHFSLLLFVVFSSPRYLASFTPTKTPSGGQSKRFQGHFVAQAFQPPDQGSADSVHVDPSKVIRTELPVVFLTLQHVIGNLHSSACASAMTARLAPRRAAMRRYGAER
jgi:hypothetical protein